MDNTLIVPLILILYGFGVGVMLPDSLKLPGPIVVAFAFILLSLAGVLGLYFYDVDSYVPQTSASPMIVFAEKWQTGLGALVGLLGLVLVEAVRAENERRHAEALRLEDARALAAVVGHEVARLRDELGRLLRNLKGLEARAQKGTLPRAYDEAAFQRLQPAEPWVLQLVVDRIGILDVLDPDAPGQVLSFYNGYLETRGQVRDALNPDAGPIRTGAVTRVETPAQQALRAGETLLGWLPARQAGRAPRVKARARA